MKGGCGAIAWKGGIVLADYISVNSIGLIHSKHSSWTTVTTVSWNQSSMSPGISTKHISLQSPQRASYRHHYTFIRKSAQHKCIISMDSI